MGGRSRCDNARKGWGAQRTRVTLQKGTGVEPPEARTGMLELWSEWKEGRKSGHSQIIRTHRL
jgi:hypothetical protein